MILSDTTFIVLFLVVLSMLYVGLRLLDVEVLEPPLVFLAGWLVIGGVLAMQFVAYNKVFSFESYVLLVVGISFFIAGALVRRGNAKSVRLAPNGNSVQYLPSTTVLLVCGSAVYVFLQVREIVEFLLGSGLSAATLSALRQSHTELALQGLLGAEHVAKATARIFATILTISLPMYWRDGRRLYVLLAGFCFVVLTMESLMHGGRSLVAFIILAIVYMNLLLKSACVPGMEGQVGDARYRRKIYSLLGFTLFFYLAFVVFPPLRNPELVNDIDFFLNVLHESQTSDWVHTISQVPGFGWVAMVAYGTAYLSQPIVKLTFFLDESDIANWYTMGAYNFPYLSKISAALGGGVDSWVTIRERIALPSVASGYPINPWASILRDFVIDFGYFGAVTAMFVFGYFAQAAYSFAMKSGTAEWLLLAGLIGPICFVSAFFSPFPIGFVSNTLAIGVFLMLYRSLMRQYGRA